MTAVVANRKDIKPTEVSEASEACAPIACKDCGIHRLCAAVGGDTDLSLLDLLVKNRRTYKRGEFLFRAGDPTRTTFAIRSGSVKTSVLTEDGRTQITGFHIRGELLGLNALIGDYYNCEARALETTRVCEVPFECYEELTLQIPGLQRQMLRIMGEEIVRGQEMMLLLGKKKAEERLATFFINLSRRMEQRGLFAQEFKLGMSRGDIGNYLGLAEETVCRVISRFEEKSLLSTDRRLVRLVRMDQLQALANGSLALE